MHPDSSKSLPPFPLVSITVEHLRRQIITAINAESEQWNEDLKRAIDRVCTPEYVGQVFEEAVRVNLEAAVQRAVKEFFDYGDGYKLVSDEVVKRCQERAQWDGRK